MSRVVYGARSSLGIAAASVTLSLILGSTLGLFAGYFGGALDLVIGRIMDVLFSFPALLLAIAVAAMLGPGVRNTALAIAVALEGILVGCVFVGRRSETSLVLRAPYHARHD